MTNSSELWTQSSYVLTALATAITDAQVYDTLTETAMNVGVVRRDDYYGAGLINAEAAVRRAYALGHDRALAQAWKIVTTA